jgi:hypothetical protein
MTTTDWFWEGNVQASLAAYLEREGWFVEQVADTAARTRGVDIRATRGADLLLVEVKGYPSILYQRGPQQGLPKRTSPINQARHWLAEAIFKAIELQAESPEAVIALALPESPRYRNLLKKTAPALSKLGIRVYLVQENGNVAILGA